MLTQVVIPGKGVVGQAEIVPENNPLFSGKLSARTRRMSKRNQIKTVRRRIQAAIDGAAREFPNGPRLAIRHVRVKRSGIEVLLGCADE